MSRCWMVTKSPKSTYYTIVVFSLGAFSVSKKARRPHIYPKVCFSTTTIGAGHGPITPTLWVQGFHRLAQPVQTSLTLTQHSFTRYESPLLLVVCCSFAGLACGTFHTALVPPCCVHAVVLVRKICVLHKNGQTGRWKQKWNCREKMSAEHHGTQCFDMVARLPVKKGKYINWGADPHTVVPIIKNKT